MRRSRGHAAAGLRLAIGVAVVSLSGCSTLEPQQLPTEPASVLEPASEPITEVEVQVRKIDIIPVIPDEPVPQKKPTPLPDPPVVSIVLSGQHAAYISVLEFLSEHLENHTVYDLSDESQPPITAFGQINDSDSAAVIAIGLRAAKSSVALSETPVVFSQVFNYRAYNLLTETSRGVAALAPLDAHLAAWKEVDPSISRIGTVIGEGHDELIAEAQQVAARHSLELVARTVNSDQEAVYQFRRMVREIDGFWLLPDNRILSPRSLREILSQANQHNVPVAVPNESILAMGATVSVESVAEDIAATIINIIRRIEAGRIDDVPPVTSLTGARIVTNDALMDKQLAAQSRPPNRTANK